MDTMTNCCVEKRASARRFHHLLPANRSGESFSHDGRERGTLRSRSLASDAMFVYILASKMLVCSPSSLMMSRGH